MKILTGFGKRYFLAAITGLLVLSCSTDNDEVNPPEGQELTQAELKTILEADEISGAVDSILAEVYMNDGSGAKSAPECYDAVYSETGFTVTFNNCVLNETDNANGTLDVVYDNDGQSASFTATYTDFYVGTIQLNGTRTFTFIGNMEQNSYSFSVSSEMTATFADETSIAENGTKTVVLTLGETLESSTVEVSGNWTVVHDGNTYSVEVTDTLEGNFSCAYLVSGIMDVNKNGLAISVDFGDGSCDDVATVIYPNGARQDVTMED